MRRTAFQEWLSRVDGLTEAQRREALAVLSGRSEGAASLAAVELGVDEERRCPRCGTPGAVSRGKARGVRRYQCKGCGRTFGALTGTPLSGLHYKERWLSFGEALSGGETVKASAERCGVAVSTAFRWRHRFLEAVEMAPDKLRGIVEADETFVRDSDKGKRKLKRKARRRGGKAARRGSSERRAPVEQVPILVAADRGGATYSAVLPMVDAEALKDALGSVIKPDSLLVSDGHSAYPPCAAALGLRHEALVLATGKRVRGALHIQTVNSRHSQLKNFLRRFRGVATRYLDSYLRWFHLVVLEPQPSPRSCLAAAMNKVTHTI
jgi:transposase-like protein